MDWKIYIDSKEAKALDYAHALCFVRRYKAAEADGADGFGSLYGTKEGEGEGGGKDYLNIHDDGIEGDGLSVTVWRY